MDQSLLILNMITTGLLAVAVIILARQLYNKKASGNKDFISIASHQLRTPLTIMKGYLSMILEGELGNIKESKIKAALSAIYQANERLIRLTNNFLEVSQLEDNVIKIDRRPFDFSLLINEIVKEMKAKAKSKNLALTISLHKKKLLVKADDLMLRQVLVNIIDNAIKYTDQGKITIKVEFQNKVLRVAVADTGSGLDQSELKGLFNKFERRSKSQEGFGLGLYVGRLIIEAHKGKIWAETRGENFGLKIIFEIPI